MHHQLQTMFPGQQHYIYRADKIEVNNTTKDRRIQTQKIGCRVFSIEHVKQLTQLDATVLRHELSEIAHEETGIYTAGTIEKDSQLVRFLRGMQTVTGLQALSPNVRRSPFGARKTLDKSMAETIDGRINKFIILRSTKYKKKKRNYVEMLNTGELEMIMENKAGFMYLHNPVLFTFSEALTSASRESLDAMLEALKKNCAAQNIKSFITGLTDAGLSDESLKSRILFRLESTFLQLENQGKNNKRDQLTVVLQEVMMLRKPTQFAQKKDYLSADLLFAKRPGRSSVSGRNAVRSMEPSPVNTPVSTPNVSRICVVSDEHELSTTRPPVLNFPK